MEKKVVAILANVNGTIPTNKGFYRPLYTGGSILYVQGDKTLLVSEPEGPLKAQKFSFSFSEGGKIIANGWFGLNGYTGKAHVEAMPAQACVGFEQLRRVMQTARKMVFAVVRTMGAKCFEAYKAKKVEAWNKKRHEKAEKLFVGNANTVPFTPAVKLDQKKAAHQTVQKKRSAAMQPTVVTVKTLSWPRRGSWCTSKNGNKYWREGCICYRHI